MTEGLKAWSRIYKKRMNINREGESGTCKRKELEGKEKEMMHGTKALGYFASVFAVNPNEWKYLL